MTPFSGNKKWCAVRWLLRSAHRAYQRSQGSRFTRPGKSSPRFGQRGTRQSVGVARVRHGGSVALGAGGRWRGSKFAGK